MSSLTKEQLKNELVSHGVELPSAAAKKSEYVEKYEKYVAPISHSKGDFSSDDEDLPVNDVKPQASLDTICLVVNGLDVSQLDDDELYSRLQDLGSPVGPIVATTRSVYQKKLFVLLGGHVPDSPTFNGDVEEEEEEEYSDSEPEVAAEPPKQTRNQVVTETTHKRFTTTTAASPSASHFTDIRRRMQASTGDDANDSSEVVYDPELHTPSPRRSLRTVSSSSTSESTTYRRYVNNASSNSRSAAVKGTDIVDSAPKKGSSCLRLLVKLIFLALLIAVALYFYQNNPTESPFKAIEELARQAIEAAAGEEAAGSPDSVDPPATAPPPAKEPEVTN